MSINSFVSSLQIRAGDEVVSGKAEGEMHLTTGEVLVTHSYSKSPRRFNLGFLPIAALTGIPAPERAIGEVVNPFKDSKEFHFVRHVKFGGSSSSMTVKGGYCRAKGDHWDGYLKLSGKTPSVNTVLSVDPTVETWLPGSKVGEISGHFLMVFRLAGGKRILATAQTQYIISGSPSSSKFESPHFRFITIQAKASGSNFRQEEQISLFQFPSEHVGETQTLKRIL